MSIHFGEVFLIALVAGMSPGPDFFVVTRNSLGFGLKVGVANALGVALALVVHVAYTVGGFAFVLVHHPEVLLAIRVLGATYLGWLGVQALRPRSASSEVAADVGFADQSHFVRRFKAILGVTPGRYVTAGAPS